MDLFHFISPERRSKLKRKEASVILEIMRDRMIKGMPISDRHIQETVLSSLDAGSLARRLARRQAREHLRYSRDALRELWLALRLSGGEDPYVIAVYEQSSSRATLHVRGACQPRVMDGAGPAIEGEWCDSPELRCPECSRIVKRLGLELSPARPIISSSFQKRLERDMADEISGPIEEAISFSISAAQVIDDQDPPTGERLAKMLMGPPSDQLRAIVSPATDQMLSMILNATRLWMLSDPEKALPKMLDDDYQSSLRQAARELPDESSLAVVRAAASRATDGIRMRKAISQLTVEKFCEDDPDSESREWTAKRMRDEFLRSSCFEINRIGKDGGLYLSEEQPRSGEPLLRA